MKKKKSLLFTSFLINLSLIGMGKPLPKTEEQLPAHWVKPAFTTSEQQQDVILEAPQTIFEEFLSMDGMDEFYARNAAQAYLAWLGEKPDTPKNKTNFVINNNKQSLINIPVEGTRQITAGLILLAQEEVQQKELLTSQAQQQASSALVTAYLLKQDFDEKKEEPIVQISYTQAPLASSTLSPKTDSSTSTPSSSKITPPWTPLKSRAFDDESPLMSRLKSDPNFLLKTRPTDPPNDEPKILLESEDELEIFFIENDSNPKAQPTRALPIPTRSNSKKN